MQAAAAIDRQLRELGQGEGGVHIGQLRAAVGGGILRQEPLALAAAGHYHRTPGGGDRTVGGQPHHHHLAGAAGCGTHRHAAIRAYRAEHHRGDVLHDRDAKLADGVKLFELSQRVVQDQRRRLRLPLSQPLQRRERQRTGIGIDLYQDRGQPQPPDRGDVTLRGERGQQHAGARPVTGLVAVGGHRLQGRGDGAALVGQGGAADQAERGCQLPHQPARQRARTDLFRHQTLQHRVHLPAADRGSEQRDLLHQPGLAAAAAGRDATRSLSALPTRSERIGGMGQKRRLGRRFWGATHPALRPHRPRPHRCPPRCRGPAARTDTPRRG